MNKNLKKIIILLIIFITIDIVGGEAGIDLYNNNNNNDMCVVIKEK